MIWFIFACVVAFGILWLIRGSKHPGGMVIPSLSLAIAILFFIAFIIWFQEGSGRTGAPVAEPAPAVPQLLTEEQLELADMQVVQGTPRTSYQLTGTIRNNGAARLDSFALSVVMQDCPDGACTVLDEDTALILARVQPGQTLPFRTTLTFPVPSLGPPAALQWDFRIGNIRASR